MEAFDCYFWNLNLFANDNVPIMCEWIENWLSVDSFFLSLLVFVCVFFSILLVLNWMTMSDCVHCLVIDIQIHIQTINKQFQLWLVLWLVVNANIMKQMLIESTIFNQQMQKYLFNFAFFRTVGLIFLLPLFKFRYLPIVELPIKQYWVISFRRLVWLIHRKCSALRLHLIITTFSVFIYNSLSSALFIIILYLFLLIELQSRVTEFE